ncbi:MAG: serine/threonine-protein phosphatase [Ruminococcaceae bacterium]|nr:serine/threonine-protein phosphatase [Oscillospiraceae bacterium]
MRFIATADTDIGISKNTNQDSLLVKHAKTDIGEVLMAIVCDGMGGLSKGELASATVIRAFSEWFDNELPFELENTDMQIIGSKWSLMLKDLNVKISEYGDEIGSSLGTTFSGILFVEDKYVLVHVGDSRIYHIGSSLNQLTTDQTFVAREISRGNMTPEQAKTDKRRNLLLQCVGASKVVEPQIICGNTDKGAYMLCSDGFRHEISEAEIYESLNPVNLMNKEAMHSNVKYLIEQNKQRHERDNISVILVKVV